MTRHPAGLCMAHRPPATYTNRSSLQVTTHITSLPEIRTLNTDVDNLHYDNHQSQQLNQVVARDGARAVL
eukprot:CAMPEP_0115599946 /NCGR_PEP_ID=MMETSP0272-20121206/14645_1 /TAXON_ID=71861 /ORGANISM="Scrippsiella trochoidea, Strain CCMP3099" /LENGTH=69 /DNA_ID=CAMNT_0003035395 /DNA_START=140 /DNA_END=349 /DNA_ORIENTATION=-